MCAAKILIVNWAHFNEQEGTGYTMLKVEEIKAAVTHLSPLELRDFSTWYKQFEAELWDKQIEQDIQGGKLDRLAEEALADYKAGRCTEL